MGNKVQLHDGTSLKIVANGVVQLPDTVLELVASHSTGRVWAVTTDGSVHHIDTLQPKQNSPLILSQPAVGIAVDDTLNRLVILHASGNISVRKMNSNEQLTSLWASPPLQSPSLDPLSHRLFVPSKLGYLAVVDLNDTPTMLPETPWQVGGAPIKVAYDSTLERIFAVDVQANRIRVINAHYGLGSPGDPIDEGKKPLSVVVSEKSNGLFVLYKSMPNVSRYALSTLLKKSPAVWALTGSPTSLSHDKYADRLLATTQEPNRLWITDASNTTGLGKSPIELSAPPSSAVVVRPLPGRLVINEAMVNPNSVSDLNGEWIEIYNPGTEPTDIAGWTIETPSQSHMVSKSSPLIVPAGGFAVLCRNPDPQSNGGVSCNYVYTNVMLANSGTTLQLIDAQGKAVDSATFSAPIPVGKSMALRHPAYNNNQGYSWLDSTSTPGAKNADVLDSL